MAFIEPIRTRACVRVCVTQWEGRSAYCCTQNTEKKEKKKEKKLEGSGNCINHVVTHALPLRRDFTVIHTECK